MVSITFHPFPVKGLSEAEKFLAAVYAELAVNGFVVSVNRKRQYAHFLRYLRTAQAPHDTVRHLIFPAVRSKGGQ